MTANQKEVLLALNLKQMQRADIFDPMDGVWTEEVARAAGRSNRSTATILSQVRDFGWVYSTHNDCVGWVLTDKGVAALERDRAVAARAQEETNRG